VSAAEQTTRNDPAMDRTCQRCHSSFNLGANREPECFFHAERFGGETVQRWLAPGDTAGAGEVKAFWSCCGNGDLQGEGCCSAVRRSFDGETDGAGGVAGEDVWGRRPGMGWK